MLIARDIEDFGRPDYTLDDLIDDWSSTRLDLKKDVVVSETSDGNITGYAIVRPQGTHAGVAPEHEGRGIGSALLGWCERRQRELGWADHKTAVGARNLRAAELLRGRGYRLARSHWNMTVSLEEVPARAPSGEEVRLRALDPPADAEAVHALDAAAFAGVPGTEPETLAAFSEDHLHAHDLDAGLSRVAERGGELAGFALVRRRDAEGCAFVDILAVAPELHGRGIGRALLLGVFGAAREAGLSQAQLRVAADNPKALRLYEGLRMRREFQLDVYERKVS